MNPTNDIAIGLDLGDRRHTVCVLSAGDDIVTEEVIVNTRECLEASAARFTYQLHQAGQGTRGLAKTMLRDIAFMRDPLELPIEFGTHNLTTNIYTEMANDTVRTELEKLPWIDKNGVKLTGGDHTPKHALKCVPEGQMVSFPDKTGKGDDRSKYVDSPLKRRVLAALDTLRQNVEMVDATGLEPVTPCV